MARLLVRAWLLFCVGVHADVYMQYPPGSNNRLAEGGGNRCVQVVLLGCVDETDIARHGSKHSRLDLAEIGPNQRMTRLGSHEGSHHRRQVVEAGRRRHPARRTVRPSPLAAESARTDMFVEPSPPVRGGDAFGPAPGEECVDQRLVLTQGFHPPCPGVGEIEPLATEHGLDLPRVSKVDRLTRVEVSQDEVVAFGPTSILVGHAGRALARRLGDEPARLRLVDGETVRGHLCAQQLGG